MVHEVIWNYTRTLPIPKMCFDCVPYDVAMKREKVERELNSKDPYVDGSGQLCRQIFR